MPWLTRPVRAHLLQAIVVALFTFLVVAVRPERFRDKELLQGASPWILAILAWSLFGVLFPPSRGFGNAASQLEPFALGELFRLLFCFGVYYAAAYWLRASEVGTTVCGVLAIGAMVALYGFARYGAVYSPDGEWTSIFGNHEQAGSYIMLLFLVPLAIGITNATDPKTRIAAQTIALLLGGALMVARTRSAWIGGLAGLIVLIALNLRFSPVKLTGANKSLLVGPLLIVVIAFGALAFSDQIGPALSERSATFQHIIGDASLADRLHRWKAACYMTRLRPLTGFGLGSFPVIQEEFTHQGDRWQVVIHRGTGHSNLAHNYWVQWASETGAIGLFLYVGAFAAGMLSLVAAIPRLARPQIALMLGFISAIAAAAVDMVGAPSYTFPGVGSLPWLWMGLGLTLTRPNHLDRERGEPDSVAPTPGWVHTVAAAIGLAVVGIVLWCGRP
jgi:O-antigen ligase